MADTPDVIVPPAPGSVSETVPPPTPPPAPLPIAVTVPLDAPPPVAYPDEKREGDVTLPEPTK